MEEVRINNYLAEEQGLSEWDIITIKTLHKKLKHVAQSPEEYLDPVNAISSIESALQIVWGFQDNPDFHRHWGDIKGCSCGTMDSRELLGTGLRWINRGCVWHGKIKSN